VARFEFRLPDIGEGLAEAEVAKWLVAVGDRVTEDQAVVEMMTDKATVELPSPAAGVVAEQLAAEGDVVKTGAVLYVLETEAQIGLATGHAPAAESHAKSASSAHPALLGPGVLAPPAVRKLAREMGVDLANVKGSGPGGRISAEDVKRHAAGAPARPAAAQPAAGAAQRIRLRGVRKRMAETMALSARTIPHVTGFHELDAGAFADLAARLRREAESTGARFPFDTLLVRATAIAARRHPIFNSSLDDERGEIVMHEDVNVGVATAVDDGLVVPVVRHCDREPLAAIVRQARGLLERARSGRFASDDLTGATFTLSNLGMLPVTEFAAVINPPQAAILAVGTIRETPVVRDGQIVPGRRMTVTVSCDHRIIDGVLAGRFLRELKGLLENPLALVL